MTTALAPVDTGIIEQVLITGDLAKLTPSQRLAYYQHVCESLGLNPLTKPFEYITLNGKLTLYARRECTEQLRKLHHVSITIAARELVEGDLYVVTSRATLPDGRTDESLAAVSLGGLKGEARANGMMKAETKSKRRVTLSVCGLGMLDETEVEDIQHWPQDKGSNVAPVAAPAAEMPPEALRVARVDIKKSNKGRRYALVTLSSGEELMTFDGTIVSTCQQFEESRELVLVKQGPATYGHPLIEEIARYEPPAPALPLEEPGAPVTLDDIPF